LVAARAQRLRRRQFFARRDDYTTPAQRKQPMDTANAMLAVIRRRYPGALSTADTVDRLLDLMRAKLGVSRPAHRHLKGW
jgi:hypothetical protein